MKLDAIIKAGLKAGTREKAQELVDAEVKRLCAANAGSNPEDTKKMLLSDIGYWAGYYSPAQAQRIYRIFDTEHPFFGRRQPSAEEGLARGMLYGYMNSGKASALDLETVQERVKREDWKGLIEWLKGMHP